MTAFAMENDCIYIEASRESKTIQAIVPLKMDELIWRKQDKRINKLRCVREPGDFACLVFVAVAAVCCGCRKSNFHSITFPSIASSLFCFSRIWFFFSLPIAPFFTIASIVAFYAFSCNSINVGLLPLYVYFDNLYICYQQTYILIRCDFLFIWISYSLIRCCCFQPKGTQIMDARIANFFPLVKVCRNCDMILASIARPNQRRRTLR